MSDDVADEIREQMIEAFSGTEYPVSSPMDLAPALPEGPATTFEAGDFSMSAMDLNTELTGGADDFPYDTPEALADDMIEALKEEDYL